MAPSSQLLYPPAALAGCLPLAIVRDTRGLALEDADRFNYFPATPLVALTIVLEGQLRMSSDFCDLAQARCQPVLSRISVTPPQDQPTQSWSDGPVHALTIGLYPDAWNVLGGEVGSSFIPSQVFDAASLIRSASDVQTGWKQFCAALKPFWQSARHGQSAPHWAGSHRLADWTRHMLTRAALSGAGQSARSVERRLKRWTGQSQGRLSQFSQLEDLYSLRIHDPAAPLAALATDANYSDQSHMGRAIKKSTGFSPAQLNALIETAEPFWCYRLLGERL